MIDQIIEMRNHQISHIEMRIQSSKVVVDLGNEIINQNDAWSLM